MKSPSAHHCSGQAANYSGPGVFFRRSLSCEVFLSLILAQMAVVLLVTLGCGWLACRLGQSRVIGEIIGGILLGPSVLGHIANAASTHLFPPSSLATIEHISTVGLVIYMFLVGMELDTSQMRRQKGTAMAASATSILIPFIAGAALSHPIRQRFAPNGIGSLPFVLFLGIGMSITAFPVLVRILEERELSATPLGTLATICAAFDDVPAWTLLAITLTLVNPKSSGASLTVRFIGLAAYLLHESHPESAESARQSRSDDPGGGLKVCPGHD